MIARRRRDGPPARRRARRRAGAAYDLSVARRDRLGRRDPLARRCKEQLAGALPERDVIDSFGASETGARRHVSTPATVRRRTPLHDAASTRPCSTTTCGPSRPARASVGLARAARPHPARLLQGRGEDRGDVRPTLDGERWVMPGDFATRRGRRHDHPARPRLGVHQHRRREGLPRRGRGGAQGAPRRVRRGRRRRRPTSGGASGSPPSSSPRPGAEPSLEELQDHARAQARRLQGAPPSSYLADEIPRTPVGKPDYRAAKKLATTARKPER